MNIIRQIQPKGAPIIVDAQTDDEGNIIKDTVRIFPIIPSDPPRIGEGLPLYFTDRAREQAKFFLPHNNQDETS
tara:strand:- start:256 stop:477 length:222 start_codon:yes stop_codon:yes gene_type:complete